MSSSDDSGKRESGKHDAARRPDPAKRETGRHEAVRPPEPGKHETGRHEAVRSPEPGKHETGRLEAISRPEQGKHEAGKHEAGRHETGRHDPAVRHEIGKVEASKAKVRADPHRVMAWVDAALAKRPLKIALLAQLILILALLLGPRLWQRESATSRLKVGERAERNVKATRTFEYYPSSEKVEKARSAAAAKILPIFDHQADLGALLLGRVGKAFTAMVALDAGALAPAPEGAPPPAAVIEERRKQFVNLLQANVSAESFAALAKASFSAEVRASLLAIIGVSMQQLVVGHRGSLLPFEGQPIIVRTLVGGRLAGAGEMKVSNLNRIKDLQEVREEIRTQATVHVAKLSPVLSKVVIGLAQDLVVPNLAFNGDETAQRRVAARTGIQARPVSYVRGQVIIRDGDPITKEYLSIVRAMEGWQTGRDVLQVLLGLGFFVLLLLSVFYRYATRQFRRFLYRPRDLLSMSVLLLGLLGLVRFALAGGVGIDRGQDPILLYALPLAGGAMLVRLLISAEAAALFSVVLGGLAGLMADQSLALGLFYMVTGLVGAAGVTQVQSRSTILRAGLAAGFTGALMILAFRMFREQMVSWDTLYATFACLGGGLLCAFLTLALLPAMEWLFAYTTDVTLLELANLNHPLLRDLILRAPGTYHHSMVVGSLSEAACEGIGANGLLARVACYYHDVGKMKNADYFAENFRAGENPHNRLKASMSALIIRSHVKDTVEMMREHGIPELVIDTATQHHGQTLIEFFYHKAAEGKEGDEEVHEEDYRYPGPKPQSREAGVLMLADGVEAAARSLAEPTEDRLAGVVQRVVNAKFSDGQLDHCDLTLRDLHLIAKSFLQVLRGIYHQRPTYPWQRKDETRRPPAEDARRDPARGRVDRPDATGEAGRPGKGSKNDRKSKAEPRGEKRGQEPGPDEEHGGAPGGERAREREKRVTLRPGEVAPAQRASHPEGGEGSVPAQPAGEGNGKEPVEPGGPSDPPPESGPDLKRLGLS